MRAIAIIPARGGSKRIPGKNIRDFLGEPIISYSIRAALASGLFKDVVVSTDSKLIADIALKYGAKVPFLRSEQNSNDHATTSDVILEVLSKLGETNIVYDYVCCIYPTAPFVTPQKLTDAYNLLLNSNYDSVLPVCAFSYPIQRALNRSQNGKTGFIYPEHETTRSQDLENTYHDAGQFYWLNTKTFLDNRKIFTVNTGSLIVDEMEVQDIDQETDWLLAELKYKLYKIS